MELVILGSGTSVPHAERASSAYWLNTSSGSVLLDASVDAVHRIAQENLAWHALDSIWISHFHLDHIGGLAPLLFGMRYAPQTQSRKKPLYVYGGYGLKKLFHAFNDANSYKLLEQNFPIEIREVASRAKFELLPGLAAQTLSTPHTRESLALRLTDEIGKSLVYTSDTGVSDSIVAFARDTDLLLLECSFRRNKPLATHLELVEAVEIIRLAKPRLAVLTHLYPEWDGIDVVAEAMANNPGREVIEARDGLRIEI